MSAGMLKIHSGLLLYIVQSVAQRDCPVLFYISSSPLGSFVQEESHIVPPNTYTQLPL